MDEKLNTKQQKKKILLIPVMFALFVGAILFSVTLENPVTSSEKDDALFSRTVVSYDPVSMEGENIVKYAYQGDKVPEKITPDEDVSKRTESSYTREISVEHVGTPREKRTYAMIAYSQPTFSKEGGDWYYLEHATTTETAFKNFRKENALATLFIPKAHADSITPFSEAGDGFVRYSGGTDFSECVNGGTGTGPNSTGTTALTAATDNELVLAEDVVYTCNIRRTFLPFDTSAMPAGSSVSAATLHLYVVSKENELNDGFDYVGVVESSQATHTTIATSDYGSVDSTQGATGIDIGSITTSAYNVFTFNSTGRSNFINASGVDAPCSATNGITCLALRIGNDIDSQAMGSAGLSNSITISTSEEAGTSQDPYLTITYSLGQAILWQMWEF